MIFSQFIELKLKAFDSSVLNKAIKEIIVTVTNIGAKYKGPITMPRHIVKFTVNRSPFIDKKSREQFEIRNYTRFLIIEALPKTIEALMKLEISAGVDIKIKMKGL